MDFPAMLYSFFLMPLQLIFELIYSLAFMLTGHPGTAIVALSLAMNFLVLPLYRRADMMQEEERNLEAKLHDGVAHIKKTFHGDERTMILQTYYRQNNYSPLYVLRSAVSLLLEIPFFIAAYTFLSNLALLDGVKFGPISDLAKPDGLINIGGFSINLLPIVMTAVNVVSTAIFTKGFPLKTKIQLYGMAAFFLVFLYDSPAGLVFYWTLNNLFSLVKTIFYKLKNPKKVLNVLMLFVGAGCIIGGSVDFALNLNMARFMFFLAFGVIMFLPFSISAFKKKKSAPKPEKVYEPNKKLFISGAVFLSVLMGILIPSAVVSASPQDFIVVQDNVHPVWYVVSTFLISSGLFVLWTGVFYWLFSPKAKVILERLIVLACSTGTITYLFFGNDHGTLSSELAYDSGMHYDLFQLLLNLIVIIAVGHLFMLLTHKKAKITQGILVTATLAILCMSGINIANIVKEVAQVDIETMQLTENQPKLTLSKDGKNVVVLMLDRAQGDYVPYIMSEYPELKEQFSGFTYYSNTISFGGYTNFGAPELFGGYEYTPLEMNKRDSEKLKDKHDESLKVLPVLFNDNEYTTTVCDPPYAGYKVNPPDLSIYDDYPEINRYITQGRVISPDKQPLIIPNRFRNFFCYSVMKVMPTAIQPGIYNDGLYHQLNPVFSTFENSYDVLKNLKRITVIDNDKTGSFIMMDNETTHNSVTFDDKDMLEQSSARVLQPYSSKKCTDKIFGDAVNRELRFDIGPNNNTESKKYIQGLYTANVASFKRIGEWFDFLKKEGVYDNTRIIIVADHGRGTVQMNELIVDEKSAFDPNEEVRYGDTEFFFPLLMVKDFNSKEFTVSNEFMTNADVPTLATNGIIDSPKNPFTGKSIDSSPKSDPDNLWILASDEWNVTTNNGTQFIPGYWYKVKDDIWKKSNWTVGTEQKVMP